MSNAPTASPGAPAGWNESPAETFRERMMLRDAIDGLLAVPLAIWMLMLFQVVPTVIAYLILSWMRSGMAGMRTGVEGPLSVLIGVAVLIDVCLLLCLPAFRCVTIDGDGLLFRRYAGPSKRVPAESLVSVTAASRSEVFRRVWLWPGIPLRGSLMCGSARDQFHIRWQGGEYYFSPRDLPGFVEALRRRRPELVSGTAGTPPDSRNLTDSRNL